MFRNVEAWYVQRKQMKESEREAKRNETAEEQRRRWMIAQQDYEEAMKKSEREAKRNETAEEQRRRWIAQQDYEEAIKMERLRAEKEFEYGKIGIPARSTDAVYSDQQLGLALRTPYRYRRLDPDKGEIRLVKVSRHRAEEGSVPEGSGGLGRTLPHFLGQYHTSLDFVQCSIEHHSMRSLVGNKTYEAISYVWGTSARRQQIVCDDCISSLSVTPNLHTVLQRLAQQPEGHNGRPPYWLDGICINQEDTEERGHQVKKMASIYRRASRVHIFLGSFDGASPDLLKSTWLTRRWIIQEAIAAQKVTIHFEVAKRWSEVNGWDALMQRIVESNIHHPFVDTAQQPANQFLQDLVVTTKTRWSGIFSLLLKFHTAQCVDDRDCLFALLGISNDVELEDAPHEATALTSQFHALKIWFKPDYTLSTEQVYLKFAVAAIRSPFAFDLLHCAGAFRRSHGESSDRTLPSWVPDWRCTLLHKPLMRATACTAGTMKGKMRPGLEVDVRSQILSLKGVLIGTIWEVLRSSPKGNYIPKEWRYVKVDWISYGAGGDGATSSIDLAVDRAYVALSDGRRAAVPLDFRIGDEVAIFVGAKTPFVLRRVKQRENNLVTHALVGDCYVADDELMTGRVALNTVPGNPKAEVGAETFLYSCVDIHLV